MSGADQGSIPGLKQADNGVWYVHWTEGRRSKRASTRTKTLDNAKAFLGQWLLMDRETPAAPNSLRVSDCWTAYRDRHDVACPVSLESSWRNLSLHFGELTVADVNDQAVASYVRKRGEGRIGGLSVSSTIRRELRALSACFNWCADKKRGILAKADVPEIDLPPEGEPRDRWLSIDEIQKLLTAASRMRPGKRLTRAERFLWLALETAARKGAIYDLTWDRVDFDVGMIHYDVPGRRRTKKRRASAPMSSSLRPLLERAYRERENDCVLDHGAEISKTLKVIARRAGVSGVSPHVLRHTAATHMARRGVPLYVVAGVLKVTIKTAERHYAHHCPERMRDAVELISGGVLEPAE